MYSIVHRPSTGAHRVAACALYRALLSQASALKSISVESRSELQDLIRNRFRRTRHFQNTNKIRLLFTAGYEAIDHLDAAVAGDAGRKDYILSLLSKAPARLKRKSSTSTQKQAFKAAPVKPESRISIFDRPLPLRSLTGPRHVPVLFNASGIPVLRFTKPQPKALSSFIVSRIKQRQSRNDRADMLQSMQVLAAFEDQWDQILSSEAGIRMTDGKVGWKLELDLALKTVMDDLENEKRKNMVMARKMQGVVDRERAAFEKEKREAEVKSGRREVEVAAAAAAAAAAG